MRDKGDRFIDPHNWLLARNIGTVLVFQKSLGIKEPIKLLYRYNKRSGGSITMGM